jgi:hypothetical protein
MRPLRPLEIKFLKISQLQEDESHEPNSVLRIPVFHFIDNDRVTVHVIVERGLSAALHAHLLRVAEGYHTPCMNIVRVGELPLFVEGREHRLVV